MRTAFVLVDVVPGMTDAVFASLAKLQGKGLVAKEKVKSGSYDLLIKVEGHDDDAIDKFLEGHVKFVSGIKAVRRIRDGAAEDAQVRQAMQHLR